MFFNIDPWGQCYKTFFARKLLIFILSLSVCWTKMEKLTEDQYSCLFKKSVIDRLNSFITLITLGYGVAFKQKTGHSFGLG